MTSYSSLVCHTLMGRTLPTEKHSLSPFLPGGVQGQVGWDPGQLDVVPDLMVGIPTYNRGIETG